MNSTMDSLTIFGVLAVSAMMIFDTLEKKNRWFTLCFAAACIAGSVYGFMQGAWPFGVVEAIWAIVKIWHFVTDKRPL